MVSKAILSPSSHCQFINRSRSGPIELYSHYGQFDCNMFGCVAVKLYSIEIRTKLHRLG